MNNTTNLTAIVAVLMAATLVVGAFATTTTTVTQSAFAYPQKKGDKGNGNDNDNDNGNTVTIEECKNKGSASGFDTAVDQECENLICTHPGENATCVQEGVSSVAVTPTSKPTTTTLEVRKVCLNFIGAPCSNPQPQFSIQITGNNNAQPSTFIITGGSSQLVTLGPGTFTIVESAPFTIIRATFSGDCIQTAPAPVPEATGTISVGQHLTCTITNTVTQD